MTDVERKLWRVLRRRQLNGLGFRRQHPMGPYVLDFYRPAIGLAIEVDGGQHAFEAKQARDQRRDAWLAGRGVHVLRFWNNDVAHNLDGVLEQVTATVAELSARLTPTSTLPLSGGGRGPGGEVGA